MAVNLGWERTELGVFEARQARLLRRYHSAHPTIRFSEDLVLSPIRITPCLKSLPGEFCPKFDSTPQESSTGSIVTHSSHALIVVAICDRDCSHLSH